MGKALSGRLSFSGVASIDAGDAMGRRDWRGDPRRICSRTKLAMDSSPSGGCVRRKGSLTRAKLGAPADEAACGSGARGAEQGRGPAATAQQNVTRGARVGAKEFAAES